MPELRARASRYLKERDSDGLIRHSLLLMMGAQVANVCNLFFQLIAMRLMGNADYGVLGVMLSFFAFCSISLGALSRAVTHYAAWLKERGKEAATVPLVRMATFDVLLATVIVFAILFFYRSGICGFFRLASFFPFALMFGSVVLLCLHGLYTGLLQGLQYFRSSTAAAIAQSMSRLAFLLAGVGGGLLATEALSAHLLSYLLGLVVCLWFVVRTGTRFPRRCEDQDRIARREFYGYSSLHLVAWVAFSLLMNLDLIMAKHCFDAETAGAFSKIVMLARMVIFLPIPVANALFPKVVSDGESTIQSRSTLMKGLLMVSLIVFSVAFGASLVSPVVLRIMNVPSGNVPLFIGMLWALVPLAFVYLLLSFELAQRRIAVVVPVCAISVAYLIALQFFNTNLWHIAICLAASSVAVLVFLLVIVYKRGARR